MKLRNFTIALPSHHTSRSHTHHTLTFTDKLTINLSLILITWYPRGTTVTSVPLWHTLCCLCVCGSFVYPSGIDAEWCKLKSSPVCALCARFRALVKSRSCARARRWLVARAYCSVNEVLSSLRWLLLCWRRPAIHQGTRQDERQRQGAEGDGAAHQPYLSLPAKQVAHTSLVVRERQHTN